MRTLLSLLPLNIIPAAMVLLVHLGLVHLDNYIVILAAVLIMTLSIEMIKSAAFALSGSASWLDFIMSLLLLIAILGYMIFVYVKQNSLPSSDWWLVAEAQLMDVIAGFYITISNARRDIGVEH